MILQLDGLVYVSGWARDALLSWLPEAARVPSAVIGNFVAPLHLEPPPDAAPGPGHHWRLELRKNHRYLLEVLAEAKRAGRSFTLDVFGDGPLRNELQQLASSLGLERQVRFRGFRR